MGLQQVPRGEDDLNRIHLNHFTKNYQASSYWCGCPSQCESKIIARKLHYWESQNTFALMFGSGFDLSKHHILPISAQGLYLSSNTTMPQKKEWPQLVGLKGEEAEKRVKHDDPSAQTQIIEEDMMFTADFRLDRVRIFVNNAGNVVKAPKRG